MFPARVADRRRRRRAGGTDATGICPAASEPRLSPSVVMLTRLLLRQELVDALGGLAEGVLDRDRALERRDELLIEDRVDLGALRDGEAGLGSGELVGEDLEVRHRGDLLVTEVLDDGQLSGRDE